MHRESFWEILRNSNRDYWTNSFSTLAGTGYWAELLSSHCRAILGSIKVTDLDYADDVAILSLETHYFWDLVREPVWLVRTCCEDIEVIKSFNYLGSVFHNSGLSGCQ